MKNLFTLGLTLLFISGFSQELQFDVQGVYRRAVKKQVLTDARLISDVIAGYPVNWISSYVSAEISATRDGKTLKALGHDNTLSPEQKNVLASADLATELEINVIYRYKNPVSGVLEKNLVHVRMTVVPETEAEYIGGYQQLRRFLKENGLNTVAGIAPKELSARIRFTINEEGTVTDARLSGTWNDAKINSLLLEAVNKMPKWKPAQNAKGEKVKQDFELTVGKGGGGC